jgi:hypothetical protein
LEKLYHIYKDRAEFFLVYIREAHPDSILLTATGGEKKLLKIPQTNKVEQRAEVAQRCVDTLKMTMPTLIDRADNQVNAAYGAWPDRLYVIGADGKIAYQGGPGPGGFRVNEVEDWLRLNTIPKDEK